MFKKLKTTTLAVVTAAATLLGVGHANAFDLPPSGVQVRGIGCTDNNVQGAFMYFMRDSQGLAHVSRVGGFSYFPGSPTYDPTRAYRYFAGDQSLWMAGVSAGCPLDEIVVERFERPENVDVPAEGDPGAAAAYAATQYIGVVFTARNTADGLYYRHEWAVSGATNTQLINTRTLITPPDTTPPTVELSSSTSTLSGVTPFTVTATFNEDVTGFAEADVTVTNGGVVAGSLSGGAAVYTFLVEPTGNGDVTIIVRENVAQDLAGNPNTASDVLVIGNRIVEITQEQIAGFMLGRANNLASNQPGLTRFLMGEGCRSFDANATQNAASLNGCVSDGNTWAEITGSWSGDYSYVLGSVGAHGFVNPDLLIGGMVQFDYTDDPANNASGHGWMIGPYFVAQVPDQPLFFEGRLLYGQTDNDITPIGTYTDSFETERWLAQLRATGEYQVQNTTLMPLLDFTYTEDSQRAYTDSLGNAIPGQTVSLMQLSTGLDFSQPLPVSTGTLILTGGISGIYSSSDGAAATPEFENWRGRTHLGLNYDTGTGATMNVGAFYDGIGTGYESYGARAGLEWRF